MLSQTRGAQAALPHLNAMVSYAPAYPLSHLKLAVQLARREDWDSARAACLNALRVALDRDDAAFAYYRFAYAEWMRDQFAVGVAAYIMSEYISPGQIGALDEELHELVARANSQCVVVPDSVEAAKAVLAAHDRQRRGPRERGRGHVRAGAHPVGGLRAHERRSERRHRRGPEPIPALPQPVTARPCPYTPGARLTIR